ncbi:MAG: hypothetical protein WBP22_00320 [Candidatus Saccharimonas sp.]
MVLLVAYDLHNPGRDYDNIIKTLKTASSWAHPQGSVWLVDTSLSPSDWVDKLHKAGDPNDEYFVSQLKHNCAWQKMDNNVVEWIKSPSRTW